MTCVSFSNESMKGHICFATIYNYKGYIFEGGYHFQPLTRELEPRQRIKKGFWEALREFESLPECEKECYLI